MVKQYSITLRRWVLWYILGDGSSDYFYCSPGLGKQEVMQEASSWLFEGSLLQCD